MNEDQIYVKSKKTAKYWQMENEVADVWMAKMGVYAFALYSQLCRYGWSGSTFVGMDKLAVKIGCSRKTVQRELDRLIEMKFIGKTSGKTKGGEGVNVYYILEVPSDRGTMTTEPLASPLDNDDIDRGTMTTPPLDNDDIPILKKNTSKNTFEKPARLFEDDAGESKPKPRKEPSTARAKLIDAIDICYSAANGVNTPFTGLFFKRINQAMEANRRWTEVEWIRCVHNRFASKKVNLGEAPETFILKLKDFIGGPLNQFGSTGGSDGGPKGSTRTDRNDEAIAEVERRIRESARSRQPAHSPDHEDGGFDGPGDGWDGAYR